MPYIITTSENVHGDELCVSRDVVSRRAVATLDEARDYDHGLGADYGAHGATSAARWTDVVAARSARCRTAR